MKSQPAQPDPRDEALRVAREALKDYAQFRPTDMSRNALAKIDAVLPADKKEGGE